jgi:hypothetical protein
MLIIYSYNKVARRQKWMPLRPPLLTSGDRYVKNRVSVEVNYLLHYFINLNKTEQQRPQPTLCLHWECVRMGLSTKITPPEGQTAHHGEGDMWDVLC